MKNKNLKKAIVVMMAALLFHACNGKGAAQTGGGKKINSADELKTYLDSQPANSPDKPIKVTMSVNEQMISKIVGAIGNAGKYVSLDLSGSPLAAIPYEAFEDCTNLTNVTIPNSVTSIGDEAFKNCTNLAAINVTSGNTNYSSTDGVLYDKNKTTLLLYPVGKTGVSFTIPNGVTSIKEYAFSGCNKLTSITIPNSVTNIGGWGAFEDCTGLTSITIPASVTTIGQGAFYQCTGLTSVTIPNSVTSIEQQAFVSCNSLTSVTFERAGINGIKNAFYSEDLEKKYLTGGIGTYTTKNPGSYYATVWTKQ